MTPVVFLPGMMCDARLFAPQVSALSGRYPVMVAPIGAHRTMEDLAGAVLDVAPFRFALLGLSMGGIVAMEMLRQAPDRVDRLALLDTNPLAEKPEVKARREPQMEAVRAGRLRAVMRDEMKPNYLADGPGRSGILDLCMDMAEQLGPEVFLNQSVALRDRIDQSETLGAYNGRALVLCGRHDRLCPPERHELMHGLLKNSRLHIVESAGHLPTLEASGETTKKIEDWLLD